MLIPEKSRKAGSGSAGAGAAATSFRAGPAPVEPLAAWGGQKLLTRRPRAKRGFPRAFSFLLLPGT
jgi:hypothetical protein